MTVTRTADAVIRVLGATSIRSDYDPMRGVYKALADTHNVDFRLLVSGAHLSHTFGFTVRQIRRDGLEILAEIDTLLDSDSPASRAKTASLLAQSSLHTIQAFDPDVILVAGDREDTLVLASIGAYLKIPTVHFFAGDHATDGNVDNPVRHAVSKLATVHFVTHEAHRQRLLRIGEPADRIFRIGSPALDRFRTEPPLGKGELFTRIGVQSFSASSGYAVLVHHPLLGAEENAANEVATIVRAVVQHEIPTFVNTPNTDAGSRSILMAYDALQSETSLHCFKNLPSDLFVNLLRHADFLIGNSSLGVMEAASIPLGVINVGKRQRGRLAAENVLFVDAEESALASAISSVRSPEFARTLEAVHNPYGDGHSVERAVDLILTVDFRAMLYKREDPLEIPYP